MLNYWLLMGLIVQPGHTVALSIDVEQAELAHLLVKEAYASRSS